MEKLSDTEPAINLSRMYKHLLNDRKKIVERLLKTRDTVQTLAAEYGCSIGPIKSIYTSETTREERQAAKVLKLSIAHKGSTHTPETREKFRRNMLGNRRSLGYHHTPEAKTKISASHENKWRDLPKEEIVKRLLETSATTRSMALEYGCSRSRILAIFRSRTTKEQRSSAKIAKTSQRKTGVPHTEEWKEKIRLWHKNNSVWKGRKHTPESVELTASKNRGRKHTLSSRVTRSARRQGIPAEQWAGFVTTASKRARKTAEYKTWRDSVFNRDNYTCQLCGKRGGRLHPHHIKPFSKYFDLRYSIGNGITLCDKPCHKQTICREEKFEQIFLALILHGKQPPPQ